MNTAFSLSATELSVGLLLILSHLPPLFFPAPTSSALKTFPRSLPVGFLLLASATVWATLLVSSIDLGEFASMRNSLTLGTIAAGILTGIFVQEFLAVRALAILLLLAADILLSAAFLHPETSRLFLVFLAYAWIFLGMFLVGMPWLLRDFFSWITASRSRLFFFSSAGIAYGTALVIASFLTA